MGNHSVSAGNNSKKLELADEERQEVAAADISVKNPSAVTTIESQRPRRRMHRVPPQVRENKAHIYDPVIISVGPYHQGQPHLLQGEKIKDDILNSTFSTKDKDLFRDKVLENLDEIRSLYEGVKFNDEEAWTELLIRDACFVLYYMKMADEIEKDDIHLCDRLGRSRAAFLFRDVFMIENQIPFWVIKQLVGLIYDKEEGEALFCNFLSWRNFGDHRLTQLPWEDDEEQEPLHLLKAHRMTFLKDEKSADHESNGSAQRHHFVRTSLLRWMRRKPTFHSQFEWLSSPFRSVKDLKAKGIYFTSSNCLTDIRFDSYSFYGKLQLIWFVTNNTSVFFSNIIAFEMSPESNTDCAVTSYVNFMNTLIDNTKDVKELREKGILFSCLGNDEEVVKVFKEIETYGAGVDTFLDVKIRIEEHCNSKLKTWMAELIHTYFHSPWTVIALFAASLLLCLTFLQTFFTIRPPKK